MLDGRTSTPKTLEAYMEREVMVFLLPISMTMDASFLKNESRVDHAVCGLPSIRLSMPKKGRSSLDAESESGISFCGSSQEAVSTSMLVVVVVTMIDEVEVDGGVVVVLGRTVEVEVDGGSVVVLGGVVVVLGRTVEVEVDGGIVVVVGGGMPLTSADFVLSLFAVS